MEWLQNKRQRDIQTKKSKKGKKKQSYGFLEKENTRQSHEQQKENNKTNMTT